jgi:hypothetical protein
MRDFMVGNIAVGIVVVDGKDGTDAAFTDRERLNVAVEAGKAFDVLYRLKDGLTAGKTKVPLFFMARIDRVKLDLDPTTLPAPAPKASRVLTQAEYEKREAPWRDPALTALGLPTGQAGISKHVQNLMDGAAWPYGPKPDAAFVMFVTKYMANWMAYASASMGRVTMCYSWLVDQTAVANDGTGGFRNSGAMGWGDQNIDRVMAHESCHIFGAPDEYAASNCSTTAKAGHLQVENSNCEVSNASSVACLMKNNTENMCGATPAHLGWVDRDNDGVLDVLAP